MKRRDWKIKKLKKGISDKYLNRNINFFFLRRLFIRKSRVFLKKDLTPNLYIYRHFFTNSIKKYNNSIKINYINNQFHNFYFVFPDFFFKKKIFYKYNSFKEFLNDNNLNYIFVKKYLDLNCSLPKGNNVILFDQKNNNIEWKKILNEDNTGIISLKYIDNFVPIINKTTFDELNFFFNYNIYLFNVLEIYKIILYLYAYNLNLKK